ncbi:hypothetical protein [Anaerotaenia torta]
MFKKVTGVSPRDYIGQQSVF